MAVLRLAPQDTYIVYLLHVCFSLQCIKRIALQEDYHRFHFPCGPGQAGTARELQGQQGLGEAKKCTCCDAARC